MSELRIEGLTKRIGAAQVLRGVGFSVAPGEILAILGASGSGKTTLLRLIAGFEAADAGRISLGAAALCGPGLHVPPQARGIGSVAQEGALFPHLSVGQNIGFGLGPEARRDGRRVAELLALVGLPADYARRPPQALSGGEQQRVALARALAPAPRLLLLDEPFSALDAGLRGQTRAAVAQVLRAAGTGAILVTHDQEEALSLGQRVGVLQHGALAQICAPQELYHRPASAHVAAFVGDAVFCAGIAEGGLAHCALGALRLGCEAAPGPVSVMIRPEQIGLCESGGVPALLREAVFLGRDALLRLELQNGLGEGVTARIPSLDLPAPGSVLRIAVRGQVMAYPAQLGAEPALPAPA